MRNAAKMNGDAGDAASDRWAAPTSRWATLHLRASFTGIRVPRVLLRIRLQRRTNKDGSHSSAITVRLLELEISFHFSRVPSFLTLDTAIFSASNKHVEPCFKRHAKGGGVESSKGISLEGRTLTKRSECYIDA